MDSQPSAEFVQIVNVNRNHWILISTVNCPPYTVDVYDSVHLSLSTHVKKLVADFLQAQSKEITIWYREVQYSSQEAVIVVFWQWPLQQAFVMELTHLHSVTHVVLSCVLHWKEVFVHVPVQASSMEADNENKPYRSAPYLLHLPTTRWWSNNGGVFCVLRVVHVACIPPFKIDADWFCIKCA